MRRSHLLHSIVGLVVLASPFGAFALERIFSAESGDVSSLPEVGAALEESIGFMVTPEQSESLVQRARPFLSPAQLAAFREVAAEFNLGKRVQYSE